MSAWLHLALTVSLAANAAAGGFAIYKLVTRQPVQPSTYAAHRDSLFAELPVQRSSIVMLGGSLNDWAEWAELLDNSHVINRGVSQATSADARRRLAAILPGKPAQVIVMVGLNDLEAGASVHSVLANHRAMLDLVREHSPDTDVIVQSILPVNPALHRGKARNQDIVRLNQELARLCRERACRFLDVHALLADPRGELERSYTWDGVHLNGRGYLIWRDALRPLLRTLPAAQPADHEPRGQGQP